MPLGRMKSSGVGGGGHYVSPEQHRKITSAAALAEEVADEGYRTARHAARGANALLGLSYVYSGDAGKYGRARRVETRDRHARRWTCEGLALAHVVDLSTPAGLSGEAWCGYLLGGGQRWSGVRARATCPDCARLTRSEEAGYIDE